MANGRHCQPDTLLEQSVSTQHGWEQSFCDWPGYWPQMLPLQSEVEVHCWPVFVVPAGAWHPRKTGFWLFASVACSHWHESLPVHAESLQQTTGPMHDCWELQRPFLQSVSAPHGSLFTPEQPGTPKHCVSRVKGWQDGTKVPFGVAPSAQYVFPPVPQSVSEQHAVPQLVPQLVVAMRVVTHRFPPVVG
jgi:hypothetical protein